MTSAEQSNQKMNWIAKGAATLAFFATQVPLETYFFQNQFGLWAAYHAISLFGFGLASSFGVKDFSQLQMLPFSLTGSLPGRYVAGVVDRAVSTIVMGRTARRNNRLRK